MKQTQYVSVILILFHIDIRHIVLGIHCSGKYGALGLSRRKTLMYKPLVYRSLMDLIQEYKTSYEEC